MNRNLEERIDYDSSPDRFQYPVENYRQRNGNRENIIKRNRSAHFEKYAGDGNRFIGEVANELGTLDHSKAFRITKAVLHAVRDRIPPDDAVQFAQGLPMMLKAVFFDQYDISRTPVPIRKKDDFIDFIRFKNRPTSVYDFPDPSSVVTGLRAVFRVLEGNMDYGQVEQVKHLLGDEIHDLVEEKRYLF